MLYRQMSRVVYQFTGISCTPLELPEHGLTLNGNVNFDAYYGDRIELGCDEGYVMVGSGELECLDTGLWSSTPPKCEPEARKFMFSTCQVQLTTQGDKMAPNFQEY